MAAHRTLLVGPSAAARRDRARSIFHELSSSATLLLLSKEQESADHFVREIAHEKGSLFGVTRMTLDALAYRMAMPALAKAGMTSHSRLGQEAVTARVIHQSSKENRLGALASVADGPGLTRALTSTIQECREHHVRDEALAELSSDSRVLGDLTARYEALSREHGVADRALVLELASESENDVSSAIVLLDVPIESPAEARFVEALVSKAEAIVATVPTGDDTSLRFLRAGLGCEPESVEPRASQAVVDLQRYVFSDEAPLKTEASADVTILSAPGEAQEAVEIARSIHAEAAAGTPFDRIAVLLRSPESYVAHLEDAFERASIPTYFEKGTKRPDPGGRAFLALMDCAAEELSASRFAEYLSLSQIPRLDADGVPIPPEELPDDEDVLWIPPQHALAAKASDDGPRQLDLFAAPEKVDEPERETAIEGSLRAPWRWEKLLVDAAVIGSVERWQRRLAGLARELEIRLTELDDPDGGAAVALQRERDDLEHLKRFALPLIELLAELPKSGAWGVWLDALEKLAMRSLAHPDGVLSMLQELRPMAAVGPVEWIEVRGVLSERLTLLSERPRDYRYGKVWVAPIDSVRGASFDVVLVPGLAERMFPRKIIEDPLLLDNDRKKLDAALPLQEDRIRNERLALRLAIGAATRRIVFSYPSVDLAKGRSKVPSFYLLEIARASQGELPDFETLEREAASSSGSRLGWPAPLVRQQAIDATEFDLAFLADALRRDTTEDDVRGTGRYLVDVNPCLARSLRAKYQRGRSGRFTSVDGFLEPSSAAKEILRHHRLDARAYSVTALEKYAGCPYRFYLNAVLRLRPRDDIESLTHLDALTRGKILHDAQFHIVQRLEESDLLPVRPENLEEVMQVFEITLDEVTERFYEELAPAIERIWRDELERIRFDLRGWLRREAKATGGFVPFRREFTFGMKPRGLADPASTLEVAKLENGLRLRGAIDLVEKRADGKVRVTDYKSGKAWMPESAIVNGGQSLQPVLYTLAYEALTGEQVDSSRLYYCTERGGYSERSVVVDQAALDVIAEFQRRFDEIIEEGVFPASPLPKFGCRFCDYISVCGPRMEIDAKRKQADPRLSPLNWLRNLT